MLVFVVEFGCRDSFKREGSAKQGITLIEIPFWWDYSLGSLAATLFKARPDIPWVDLNVAKVIPSKFSL